MFFDFLKPSKRFLGIDIGTSTIKIVEISKKGERIKLENYGMASLFFPEGVGFKETIKGFSPFSPSEISQALLSLLKESKIRSSSAIFSIPDFATLFTAFSLPAMSSSELAQAVKYEAKRHVPLSLSEVTLDWSITKGKVSGREKGQVEILLVVVPNVTISQYTQIAHLCHLNLLSLEAEVFGLVRSLVKDDKETICLIDIGARSTTCSIVDQKILRSSHSFDIGGAALTERVAQGLDLHYQLAQEIKEREGLLPRTEGIREVLLSATEDIAREVQRVTDSFQRQDGKEVKRYILAGGSAVLPGLKEYLASSFKKEVTVADPFSDMIYPPILEKNLKEIGPSLSVAAGMALKGLEY